MGAETWCGTYPAVRFQNCRVFHPPAGGERRWSARKISLEFFESGSGSGTRENFDNAIHSLQGSEPHLQLHPTDGTNEGEGSGQCTLFAV